MLADPDLLSLTDELAMAKAYLAGRIERFPDNGDGTHWQTEIAPAIDQVRKLALSEAMLLRQRGMTITLAQASAMVQAFADILFRHVVEPERRRAVIADLEAISRRLASQALVNPEARGDLADAV